jgi:hypothetical protein
VLKLNDLPLFANVGIGSIFASGLPTLAKGLLAADLPTLAESDLPTLAFFTSSAWPNMASV